MLIPTPPNLPDRHPSAPFLCSLVKLAPSPILLLGEVQVETLTVMPRPGVLLVPPISLPYLPTVLEPNLRVCRPVRRTRNTTPVLRVLPTTCRNPLVVTVVPVAVVLVSLDAVTIFLLTPILGNPIAPPPTPVLKARHNLDPPTLGPQAKVDPTAMPVFLPRGTIRPPFPIPLFRQAQDAFYVLLLVQ